MPAIWVLAALLLILFVFGILTPPLMKVFRGAVTPVRIMVALSLLFPPGILMGTAFPLGMLFARQHLVRMIPWYWGINGAMSVFASVLAVTISLNWGISSSFWTGLIFYTVAFISTLIMAYRVKLKSASSA